MEQATWVIAAFTIVLAVATTWNIWITQGLLKQSKKAHEQSSMRYLFDTADRLVSYIEKRTLGIGLDHVVEHCKNRLLILARINPQEAERIWEALEIWKVDEKNNTTEKTFEQWWKKEDPDFKKQIDLIKEGKEIEIGRKTISEKNSDPKL